MVQIYETMMTRHTSMVVGPTGGGKSVVISTLCQAQTRSVLVYFTKLYTTLLMFDVDDSKLYFMSSSDRDCTPRFIL